MTLTAAGTTILVLAKAPRPGHSKTRLIPAFGSQGATDLAAAALTDTLQAVRSHPGDRAADRVLVLDGSPVELADLAIDLNGFRVVPQVPGDHAERIIAAFETAAGPAVLVGMDTPQLDPGLLVPDLTAPIDAWFGPAEDGGWWMLGLRHARRDARRVLSGVPMSTAGTGAATRERLVRAGLRVADLPTLRDVDLPADAFAVAADAPHTRFARSLNQLMERPGMVRTPA